MTLITLYAYLIILRNINNYSYLNNAEMFMVLYLYSIVDCKVGLKTLCNVWGKQNR